MEFIFLLITYIEIFIKTGFTDRASCILRGDELELEGFSSLHLLFHQERN